MAKPTIVFEDFTPGEETVFGPVEVTAEEIVDFAREWDPQPMHLSEDAGRETLLGGLTASGWHTCCLFMRMMCDEFVLDSSSMGAPGIEEVRWIRPVRPGDRLTAKRTILEARISAKRPDMGVVRSRYEITNQTGETVMTATFPAFFGRRPGSAGP